MTACWSGWHLRALLFAEEGVFWDLRTLNGADGHKYDAFWEEMGKFLQLEVGAGAHERRAPHR